MSNYPEQPSPQSSMPPGATPAGPEAPRPVRVALPASTPYVTYAILAITVFVYVLQFLSIRLVGYANAAAQMDLLEAYGAMIPDLIRSGQIWRLLTPMLLHASVLHIFFNMYAVYAFGPSLERNFGHWRFLVLYLLGGFAGSVLSFLHWIGTPEYSVGASTAIFGLIAAEGVFLYQNRKMFGRRYGAMIGNILFVVAVNLFLVGSIPGIDNWGHIGGLIGGLIFAWFASPIWEVQGMLPDLHVADKREPRDVITGAAIVILVFGALAIWGMVKP